jgi:hypothetical protein
MGKRSLTAAALTRNLFSAEQIEEAAALTETPYPAARRRVPPIAVVLPDPDLSPVSLIFSALPNLNLMLILALEDIGIREPADIAFHARRINPRWPLADRIYTVIRRAGEGIPLETYRQAAEALEPLVRELGVE